MQFIGEKMLIFCDPGEAAWVSVELDFTEAGHSYMSYFERDEELYCC